MSNLGLYQTITTVSKRVGGPRNFLLLVAGGGYVVLRGAEAGVKKIGKMIKGNVERPQLVERYYEITSEGSDDNGLHLKIGDKFRVIEHDNDVILIERIGDTNNPYYTSCLFLESISDFKQGEVEK